MTAMSLILVSAAFSAALDAVLLDFTASWCGPCQEMSPVISRLQREGFPVRKVDVDQRPDLSRKYGIRSIPAFVLVIDGKEKGRVVGVQGGVGATETQLRRLLAKIPRPSKSIAATKGQGRGVAPRKPQSRVAGVFGSKASASSKRGSKLRFQIPFLGSKSRKKESNQVAATDEKPVIRAKLDGSSIKPVQRSADNPLATSTRIRVKDRGGVNIGSGTIIDSRPGRTLILTCGHIFRGLDRSTKIEVDVFAGDRHETFLGEVVRYDLESDVGLIAIPTSRALMTSRIALPAEAPSKGRLVYSVGCSEGRPPTREQMRVTAIDPYVGLEQVECTTVPAQGRSGGGLFDANGRVIGVCNAADPKDRRGLYASLPVIHALLDRADLSRLNRPAGLPKVNRQREMEFAVIEPPRQAIQPRAGAAAGRSVTATRSASSADEFAQIRAALEQAGDAEVICIVRSRNNPNGASRVVIINRASSKLASYLAGEMQSQPTSSAGDLQQASKPSRTSFRISENSRGDTENSRHAQPTRFVRQPTADTVQRYRRSAASRE